MHLRLQAEVSVQQDDGRPSPIQPKQLSFPRPHHGLPNTTKQIIACPLLPPGKLQQQGQLTHHPSRQQQSSASDGSAHLPHTTAVAPVQKQPQLTDQCAPLPLAEQKLILLGRSSAQRSSVSPSRLCTAIPPSPTTGLAASVPLSSLVVETSLASPHTSGSFQLSGGKNGNETDGLLPEEMQLQHWLPLPLCEQYVELGFKDADGRPGTLYPWQVQLRACARM